MGTNEKITVAVGNRTLELSNLEHVLYPDRGILKAEVIAYYHTLARVMLRHIQGRPLTLIRYPDGIEAEGFYQKNAPDWAPIWVRTAQLGREKKNYIIPIEPATLVWLANQAALEIHVMNVREPYLDRPDHLVFDLDPPEEQSFTETVELGMVLRDFLAGLGYHPFAKTSGKKGLHIIIPIEQRWSVEECYDAVRSLAQRFVRMTSGTTLSMNKERRRGKTLIDIVRNAPGQTIIAPYSLRAVPGAPVSCPVSWDELGRITQTSALDMDAVLERQDARDDPWESIWAYASRLHSDPHRTVVQNTRSLNEYDRKRDFDRTPEPVVGPGSALGNRFVLHRHHATRLHYDLRFEEGGVLRSWAVPKGLPPRPGIKRLAIQTEDHPVEYLNFEGNIPRGEYGGGSIWIFSTGRYEMVKKKPSSLHVRLHADGLGGEYRLIRTGEKEWIVERLDEPGSDLLWAPIDPMAPHPTNQIPESPDFLHELKWDGIRAVVVIDEGVIRITTRNGLDVTDRFPELLVPEVFNTASVVLDGEIVCLNQDGLPDFEAIVRRTNTSGERRIQKAAKTSPAYCMLFDCLYLDGRSIVNESLTRRREWLEDLTRSSGPYVVTDVYEDPFGLWDSVVELNLEGIVSKRKDSPYRFGDTHCWLKTKRRKSAEFVIIGYTQGKGARHTTIGALHLAEYQDNQLIYRGKVGTGLTRKMLEWIHNLLRQAPPLDAEVAELPREDVGTVWVQPSLVVEVAYAGITPRGRLRKPVFVRLRPDISKFAYINRREKQSI